MNHVTAPLSDSLFMMVRELPSYLSVAHSIRYKDVEAEKNLAKRVYQLVSQYFQLIKEVLTYKPSVLSFQKNVEKLNTDFNTINQDLKNGTRPICVYCVSDRDSNGAILGDHVYYYHHYKIRNFQKHYDVAAKVILNSQQARAYREELKSHYPNREIKVVNIVAHGEKNSIDIGNTESGLNQYSKTDVELEEFRDCAPDATIILDCCLTGAGVDGIAERIAKNNKGKTVIAPGSTLCFSKPIFKTENGETAVKDVVHGFALVNAYTSKKFKFDNLRSCSRTQRGIVEGCNKEENFEFESN